MDLVSLVVRRLAKSQAGRPNIILNDDISHNDTDGDVALYTAIMLHLRGDINLVAVIMNTKPEVTRARIARGMLDSFRLYDIPVGVGSEAMEKMQQCDEVQLIPYYTEHADDRIFEGNEVMELVLNHSADLSLKVVGNGPLSDFQSWLETFPEEFKRVVSEVVLMSGVEDYTDDEGRIIPNATKTDDALGAMNNVFNRAAARYVYKKLQDLMIPLKIVTKIFVFEVMMRHSICPEMGWIGESLEHRAELNIQRFWEDCCAVRITPDRNREWFVKFILGGKNPPIADGEPILPYISDSWPLYDMTTVMVAAEVGLEYLDPEVTNVFGVNHQIIGRSKNSTGLANKEGFKALMEELLRLGAQY